MIGRRVRGVRGGRLAGREERRRVLLRQEMRRRQPEHALREGPEALLLPEHVRVDVHVRMGKRRGARAGGSAKMPCGWRVRAKMGVDEDVVKLGFALTDSRFTARGSQLRLGL